MDVSSISTHAGKGSALSCVAQFVRILLVDHDTTSLISLASQLEQQLYKVTTTESAAMALSLFQARDNYYDIVIADIRMPEMGISEFVNKLHAQRMTVPIILIAKDFTVDSAREALANGVCYVFPKPPRHSDIASVWQHIPRVTGELPALLDMTTYNDIEKDGNPSSDSSSGGAARNHKGKNLKMKSMIADKGHKKRKKNQIAETSNSSNDAEEEDGNNSKKPRITWNYFLHEKFLHAINILGEHGHEPQAKTILLLMNEPGLTYRHVASHLQKYRERTRHSLNLLKTASPVMPAVLPSAPLTNFMQGQTSVTASSNYTEAPHFMHYSFDGVKQSEDAFSYSGNNSVKAIINHYGVRVPGGNGGVQEPAGASGHLSNGWEALNQEPAGASIGHLTNCLQVPNRESAGSSGQVMPINGQLNNGLQAPTQGPAGASGQFSNGWEAPNQEPAGEVGTVLYGLRNAGDMSNMNSDDHGEGTSGSNQQFDGMPSNDDINQFIKELEACAVNIWDLIN